MGWVLGRTINRAGGRVGTLTSQITTLVPFRTLKGALNARGVVLQFAFLPTGTEIRGKHFKGGGQASTWHSKSEFYPSYRSFSDLWERA